MALMETPVGGYEEKKSLKRTMTSIVSEVVPAVPGYEYLMGVRGLLAIQSFLWVFLTTFVPTAVKNSQNPTGPGYQIFLRKILSVVFWNDGLIYSGFILLSARTVCLPFLQSSTTKTLASAIFRRTASLVLPVAVSLAVVALIFNKAGNERVNLFMAETENLSITAPYQISNPVIYFNSLFMLFWTTKNYTSQAASQAFPSGILWILSVIYQQSYTVYMTVLIIPYTRPAWRIQGFTIFIITAFWVQSWAWYTITGVLLADAVHNMKFREVSARGLKVYRSIRLPTCLLYLALMAGGLVMQYIWSDWRPELENKELEGHSGMYYTAGLNSSYDLKQPQARDDNYLILLGFFLLLETSSMLRWIFSNPVLMFLGRRSYSYLLTQSILIYTIGIKLFTHLRFGKDTDFPLATLVTLITSFATTGLVGEIMYRAVELPGKRGAHAWWKWMQE